VSLSRLAILTPFHLGGILLGLLVWGVIVTPLLAGSTVASLIALAACVFLGVSAGNVASRIVLGRR
jgi:hypothetical protein